MQDPQQVQAPTRGVDVHGSTAIAARGWLVTLGLVAAVGVVLQLGGGWSLGLLAAILVFVSLVFVGVPVLVHLVFGVRQVVANDERITITLRRGGTLDFTRAQVVRCTAFRIPRLSVELRRLVTERGTRWLSLSGFGNEAQATIRALLEPSDAPDTVSWRRALAMRIRGAPAGAVRRAFDAAREQGLPVTLDMLEAHALAGGDVERVVAAALRARERGRSIELLMLLAADAAGQDLDALIEGQAPGSVPPSRP